MINSVSTKITRWIESREYLCFYICYLVLRFFIEESKNKYLKEEQVLSIDVHIAPEFINSGTKW